MRIANLKFSLISLAAVIVAAGLSFAAIHEINSTVPVVPAGSIAQPAQVTPAPAAVVPPVTPAVPATPTTPAPDPNVLNLPIPFTPQAPTGNWDELHNEACEEAAAIMANAYLTGDRESTIPAARVEAEIASLTVWEDKNFGYHLDTTAAETAKMIEGSYELKATVQYGYTLQDVKDQLTLHNVVVLPVNGQLVGNPYYKSPGPIYHMLVIRGYTATGLITDDSGTKRGENYPYTFSTLYTAGADWDHAANTIDQSKKPMIVISKQ